MAARGRPPGARHKPWQDAIEKAAREQGEKGEKLLMLAARRLVAAAVAGDIQAAKEMGDRLDGRAHQSIDMAVSDERMGVNAPTPEESADDWAARNKPH